MTKIVSIVGRPNVGKSSIFNALLRKRVSITSEIPGVTRDRVYQKLKMDKGWIWLVDTGGFMPEKNAVDPLAKKVLNQIEAAIDESDLCLFIADSECEITDQDIQLANLLLRKQKEIWLIVNKIDRVQDISPFYKLGLGEPFGVSAIQRSNISKLLEKMNIFAEETPFKFQHELTTIACFGKPNVGKSSLINRIIGEERVIVSEIPGTTRDRILIPFKYNNKDLILLDTAGIRKKSKLKDQLEFLSFIRTLKAIPMTDIGILLLDAETGMTSYEIDICQELVQAFKAIVMVFNKIDLVIHDKTRLNYLKSEITSWIPFFPYIKPYFISAKTGRGVEKIIKVSLEAEQRRKQRISTALLQDFLKKVINHYNPPVGKFGRRIKIGFLQQTDSDIPHFVFLGRHLEDLQENYKRYLRGQFYKNFDFVNVPIKIDFKAE